MEGIQTPCPGPQVLSVGSCVSGVLEAWPGSLEPGSVVGLDEQLKVQGEPHKKTCFLHMQKQRCRSAAQ